MRSNSVRTTFAAICLALSSLMQLNALCDEDANKSINVADFTSYEGFFDFYWDEEEGKIWLRLKSDDEPFLYVTSLATGLGSNPVGLDRGQLGQDRLVRFRQVGNKVFLIQENVKYRASSSNPAERRAIQESFANSILWSGDIKDGLVDITSLLVRDAHDCIGTLESSGQGSYKLDKDRSFVYLPRTKAFPKNTEFEVTLTFESSKPGRLASRTAADGKSVSLRQHHSFVELPSAGFRPREWDPRVGAFAVSYADYSAPIDEPIEKRLITRHRLEKRNPDKSLSPPKNPIIYYVDNGVPEPVLSALIEGASWWNEAFEAAGFENAFLVKVLPENADPMDVRYNVIQWVHRATRGWSYGQSFTDPRTGEIIKGHVLLGSLRVRQDHLLFEGLGVGKVNACGLGFAPQQNYLSQVAPDASSLDIALARIRQLSAHEVGHTLGFAHNFAASTYADRASVMDYPAPKAQIASGKLDLSDAYGVGIGEWDKFSVQYAYGEYDDAELEELIQDSIAGEMLYITDADARPAGAAHPLANLWDNGEDPVSGLKHELEVRKIALSQFGIDSLGDGQPLGDLEKVFVPLYMHHRYQVDAAAKMLGGFLYSYAIKGDGQTPIQPVPGKEQWQALEALLATLSSENLAIPKRITDQMAPKVYSSPSDRERFESSTSPIFDTASAIRSAAELTIANLLQPERAARLVLQEGVPEALSLSGLCNALGGFYTFEAVDPSSDPRRSQVRRIVQSVYTEHLIDLAGSPNSPIEVRAIANQQLFRFSTDLKRAARTGEDQGSLDVATWLELAGQIDRFLERSVPEQKPTPATELPPGSPIGSLPR